MLFFILFARPIIELFNDDPEVIRYGVIALQIVSSGYIFYGIGMVMIQALNGAGDTKTPTWINFFGFWVFQIPFAYILANGFNLGVVGVVIAIPVAETAMALASYVYFKKGKWKEVKV
jgi:Na+-driven multidrug efflux pump